MGNYEYRGISTNNLKNIDITFKDHELIYIGGASGSGKSSLAFDTIAAISDNEYKCINSDNGISVGYRVREYSDVLVAATLKQLNLNVNPRSTIATYFGLYPHLAYILSFYTGKNIENFSSNSSCRCSECNGLGYKSDVDPSLVVDRNRTIKEGPFKCWNNSYSDFFSQLLALYCDEKGIDISKKWFELSKIERYELLYDVGTQKYKIHYLSGGRKRSRTTEYIGPITWLASEKNDMSLGGIDKYSRPHTCPSCRGSRIAASIGNLTVKENLTVNEILSVSFDSLGGILAGLKNDDAIELNNAIKHLLRFIDICKRLNIGHLGISRSISTLSGGELQRIRISQLLMGKLRNLLVVLDEPTSSLNAQEAHSVVGIIKELGENNTVIVVDHNNALAQVADRKYYLGPGGGNKGGNLISEEEFIREDKDLSLTEFFQGTSVETIKPISDYIQYLGDFRLHIGTLHAIEGESGIGKTTLLRDILPYAIDGYKYISQKPIKANRFSTVASYADLLDDIKTYYAKKFKKDKRFFSIRQEGCCSKCGGRGSVSIGNFYEEQVDVKCEACGGTGYSKRTLDMKIDKMSIYDFLQQSVDEIRAKKIFISKKINNILQLLYELGLGHLILNQKINTLSGGENQRIKLYQAMADGKSRFKIFGLDEPTKGLGKKEIAMLIILLYNNIKENGKTFVVSEHNAFFLAKSSYVTSLSRTKDGVVLKEKANR